MSTRFVRRIALALPLLLIGSAAMADKGEGELGIQTGVVAPDCDLTDESQGLDNLDPVLGLRGGYQFAERWGWFIDAWLSEQSTPFGDADTLAARTGVEHLFGSDGNPARWFLGFGGGRMEVDAETAASFDRTFLSLGFGQRFELGERTRLRWEIRSDHTVSGDDGFPGDTDLWMPQALLGLTWGIGVSKVDSDGDGVLDRKDRCPDTPQGAVVDEKGCPIDSDGDGVWDGIDKCPDTPAGTPVDERGCPKDSDGDGVHDGLDKCPDTPRGAKVDADGCPMDSDGDGVWDGIDKCPDTDRGAKVDAKGCPMDSDGDGVWDGIDKCPDTPRGAKVDAKGCPMDSDGDGVWDGLDRCPGTPAGTRVDANGCAERLFKERKTLVLEGVNFELNQAVLTSDSTEVLDRVAASLLDWAEVRVEIAGHTDSTGAESYNRDLSERRAQTVRDYLVKKGVAAERMTVRGYGESQPIADNGTKSGRAANRRVELRKLD